MVYTTVDTSIREQSEQVKRLIVIFTISHQLLKFSVVGEVASEYMNRRDLVMDRELVASWREQAAVAV